MLLAIPATPASWLRLFAVAAAAAVHGLVVSQMLMTVIIPLVYLVFPFDLIPEAVFGVFGLLDDVFFIGCGLFILVSLARSAYDQRMRAE
jgi:uncharacterized membrane protein YkvA (DUF1232 family)